jgi:hypothetical protein
MRIKARVSSDNGGYEVNPRFVYTESNDPVKAIEKFVAAHQQVLVPGGTAFHVDGVRRYRWDRLKRIVETV